MRENPLLCILHHASRLDERNVNSVTVLCVCLCVCVLYEKKRERDRWTADVEARAFTSEGPALGPGSGEEEAREEKSSERWCFRDDTTTALYPSPQPRWEDSRRCFIQ